MGLTSSSADSRISLDEKLQFLQTRIIKQCSYHRKQAILICSIPNCDKCPYACNDCVRQKIHQHQDGLYNHNQFIKVMVTLLEIKKNEEFQKMKSTNPIAKPDHLLYQKQTIKILQHIDSLQKQIQFIIGEYRKKLQSQLERLNLKITNAAQNKSNLFFNFYCNPNILACKLATEQGDSFLLSLKNQLKTQKPTNPVNEDQQLSQLKNQLGIMKGKIRDILNVINVNHFARKNSLLFSNINCALKKTFILPSDSPLSMAVASSTVNVITMKDVYGVDATTKDIKKILSYPLSLMGVRKQGQQFIGLINQSKIVIYDGRNANQISLPSKVAGLSLLKSKRRMYGLIGQESGVLNIIDLQQNRESFHYRCSDQPLCHIQVSEANSLICCAGRKTPIFIFRYKYKFLNLDEIDELEFEYTIQMNYGIVPQGQLQLMRLSNSQLYLFGPCKNIVLFDLMLNTQIIRTQNTRKCSPFIEAQFLAINGCEVMLSLSQGEDVVNIWQIDKTKRTVKVQEILKQNNARFITSLACIRNQLWAIRESQKNVDIFSINFE